MPSFESEAAFSGYCNAGHQPLTIQQLTLLLWPQLQAADTARAPPTPPSQPGQQQRHFPYDSQSFFYALMIKQILELYCP